MWQVVFANVLIEGRVVDFDVNSFLMVLAILCPFLPMILKFSTDVVWPVVLLCSNIGDGAFTCSLYLSSKVLTDSPISSSLQLVLPHLYQYMMLLCFVISSLYCGHINKFFKVFPPLKYTWTTYLPQMVL